MEVPLSLIMFQLNKQELDIWKLHFSKSQSVTLKRGQNIKYAPYVFTEQGVAMLSSVLNSTRAIHINIQIIRTFTKLREMISTHTELRQKIENMEKKYDRTFKVVFDVIARLLKDDTETPKKQWGFTGRTH